MMRKTAMALVALAAIGLAGSTTASAHGPGGMGGGHMGGMGGGHFGGMGGGHFGGMGGGHFGGGHFEGGHFGGFHHGFHRNVFVGFGFGPSYYGGYPYYDNYDDEGCYLIRRRVLTPHGWRIRRVEVCS